MIVIIRIINNIINIIHNSIIIFIINNIIITIHIIDIIDNIIQNIYIAPSQSRGASRTAHYPVAS